MRIFSRKTVLFITAAVSLTAAGEDFFCHFPESMLPGDGQRERLFRRSELALFSGNIRCADAILQVLRTQNPLLDNRMLPVQLQLAKNKEEEARKIFLTMADSGADTPDAELARCMLGRMLLESGNPCAAICCFQRLAGRPHAPSSWRAAARCGELHAWLRLGNYDRANAILRQAPLEFPKEIKVFYLPELLTLSSSGRSGQLLNRWKELRGEFEPKPDPALYRILLRGYEQAADRGSWQTAQGLLTAAYHYASSDAERQDTLRKLINIQSEENPERAIETISFFLQFYPALPDRHDLEMQRGFLYYQLGKFQQASDCFARLFKDSEVPEKLQVDAAEAAAQSAEKSRNFKLARRMYHTAISLSSERNRRRHLQIALLKFLLRSGDYTRGSDLAEKIESLPGKESDELDLLHIQALTAQKNFAGAAEIARRLQRSRDPRNAAEGLFQLAWSIEQQGDKNAARSCYRQYCEKYKDAPHAPEAHLAAAEIALQNGDYAVAGREFEKFPGLFADHPKAPGALLTALYAVRAQDKLEKKLQETARLYGEIAVKYPNSPEHDTAALLTAEGFFFANRYADTAALLDELCRRSPESPLLPEVLLLKARTLSEQKKSQEAFRLLMETLGKYPTSPLAADIALNAGRCAVRLGNYQQALNCYSRAGKLAGDSLLKETARCESADCRLMLKSPKETEAALGIYRDIAGNPRYPVLQLEAAFKAGTILEQLQQPEDAIVLYERMLELVHSNRKYLLFPGVADWCSRSVRSALQLMMKTSFPNGSQRAHRILRLYTDLSIPGSRAAAANYRSVIDRHYGLEK